MKKILFFIIIFNFINCRTDRDKNQSASDKSASDKNQKTVKASVESKEYKKTYTWNFKRNYNKDINLVKSKKTNIEVGLLTAFNQQIVASDLNYSKMYFFDKNLDTIHSFGKKGNAPDEINFLEYYAVFQDTIIIHDFGQHRHKRFVKYHYLDDERIFGNVSYAGKYLSPHNYYMVFTEYGKGKYIVLKRYQSRSYLKKYDLQNLFKLPATHNLEKDPNTNVLVSNSLLYGKFATSVTSKNNIYYLSHAGYFVNLDSQGNLVYLQKTIDRTPFPYGSMKDLGGGYKTPKIYPYTYLFDSGTNNDQYFYLLNHINQFKNDLPQYTVDYYLVKDGSYAGSFDMPYFNDEQPKLIAVSPDNKYLYVFYENTSLCKYEIQ